MVVIKGSLYDKFWELFKVLMIVWLSDGDFEVIVSFLKGIVVVFYGLICVFCLYIFDSFLLILRELFKKLDLIVYFMFIV